MLIAEAQREMRTVYLWGGPGQLVSGALWLVSAALADLWLPQVGIALLLVGGMFIFPLTQLVLRLMGRPASVGPANTLRFLAMQVAFTVPLSLPLVGVATLYRQFWFFPAMMIVVGAHYLPFIFLYGMWQYGLLAGVLIGGGLTIALRLAPAFSVGGWVTGLTLVLFGLYAMREAAREAAGNAGNPPRGR